MTIVPFLGRVSQHVLNPIIIFLFTVAVLVFVVGIVRFIASAGDEAGRERGKRSMMWGIVGLFIMISVYGIIRLILATFEISGGTEGPGYLGL